MPLQSLLFIIERFPQLWESSYQIVVITSERGYIVERADDSNMSMLSAAGAYSKKPGRQSESIFSAVGRSTIRLAEASIAPSGDIWQRSQNGNRRGSRQDRAAQTADRSRDRFEERRVDEVGLLSSSSRRTSSIKSTTGNNASEITTLSNSNNTRSKTDSNNKSLKRRGTLQNLRRKFSTFRVPNSKATNNGEVDVDPNAEHDCTKSGCERIRLNVSGQYYDTFIGLLNRHPDTLLGNSDKRRHLYDPTRNEIFIDRHRPSFEAVFEYYQHGGKIKRPHNVPDDIFLSELVYYELEHDVVEQYKVAEGYTNEEIILPENETLRKIWMLFEFPETSYVALVIAVISVVMTVTSIILFCVETLPVFAQSHCVKDEAPNFLDPFFIVETTCTLWFTLELLVRFIACPDKLLFWKDFKNIVDLTAIIPYYVTFVNVMSTMSCASAKSSASLAFLRVIRLIRVFKLTKHSVGLQILILTFKASIEGLGLFLIALAVCLLVFSSAIYFVEQGVPGSQIGSIPDAFWWAIITMTTVGYGDKVPVGPWGKLIGSICALVGVLTLAIPVPIITGNFNRFYAHKTGRRRPA